MPYVPTFNLRAQLLDPSGNPLVGVPVCPFAVHALDGTRAQLGEVHFTNDEGFVEIDLTGSPAVTSPFLASIQLRHAETDFAVAEQWFSLVPGDPQILDLGQIRVWEAPIFELPGGPVVGVMQPIVDALGVPPDVAALETQLAATQSQLAATQNQLASIQNQLATSQTSLAATQAQLSTLQLAYDEATSQLATLTDELAALQAGSGTSSSIGAVVENVGMQLAATQQALLASGSPFQLGKLSLSLKVVPSSSTAFGLPTMEELGSLAGEALSTLHLDFAQTVPTSAPIPDASVPSLHGLTEPAARRQLAALGLGASVVHQAIADDGDVVLAGRVCKQIPAAGMTIPRGQRVTLVLGKALGSAS